MATRKLPNYLRTYRKRTGLTQKEVGYLLGHNDGSEISQYEQGTWFPNFRALAALETALRVPIGQLFAGAYEEIEVGVLERTGKLIKQIQQQPANLHREAKLQSLRRIIEDLSRINHDKDSGN